MPPPHPEPLSFNEVLDDVRAWLAAGDRVIMLAEGPGPAERIAASLRDEGIAAMPLLVPVVPPDLAN